MGTAPLASRWLQLVSHRGADDDVLSEGQCRVLGVERKIWQGDVTGDTETAIASREVPENSFLSFVPDDGVLGVHRVARCGGARWSGAGLLPELADPFVKVMHSTERCECLGITACKLDGGWHGLPILMRRGLRSGDGAVRSSQPGCAVRVMVGVRRNHAKAFWPNRWLLLGSRRNGPGPDSIHRFDDEEKDDEGNDKKRDEGVDECTVAIFAFIDRERQ